MKLFGNKLKLVRGNTRTWLILAACAVAVPTPRSLLVGGGLVVLGCLIHTWSKGCLRQDDELTMSGPYRWVRNPFYIANALIEGGFCVITRQWWLPAVYFPVWLIVYHRQILSEEASLLAQYGDRFRDYMARVPRYVPWKGPVGGLPPSLPFSWTNPNLCQGREYPRVVRILIFPLLIWGAAALRLNGGDPLASGRILDWACWPAIGVLLIVEWILRRVLKRKARPGAPEPGEVTPAPDAPPSGAPPPAPGA
jgi:hypothetical protein